MRNDASLDLKRYIEIEPPKTSRDYECLSLDFEMLDNHEQALQYAKLAYAATTDSIQEGICLFMIGSIYHLYYHHGWIENYDKALEYYSKGLSLLDQPDNYAPDELSYRYRKRAKLFSELGMHDKAIVDYQRAIKLSNKKNDYMLQREIGKALLKMGNYEDAIHHYLSSDLPCNYELATAYGLAGDKKNMKKYFRKYLSESNPPCGIYASIKQSTTHLDPADVEFVAERKAFVAEELYEMGVANAVLGNKKIAIDNFRKSFKMLPETKLLETDLLLLSSYQHLVCR
jgi:tetratricopeptide (TPR) repeat protein